MNTIAPYSHNHGTASTYDDYNSSDVPNIDSIPIVDEFAKQTSYTVGYVGNDVRKDHCTRYNNQNITLQPKNTHTSKDIIISTFFHSFNSKNNVIKKPAEVKFYLLQNYHLVPILKKLITHIRNIMTQYEDYSLLLEVKDDPEIEDYTMLFLYVVSNKLTAKESVNFLAKIDTYAKTETLHYATDLVVNVKFS